MQGGGGGGDAAACVTVNVWPATVMVPVRAAPLLAAATNATVPFPLPLPPDDTVSHEVALLIAVQAQPLPADTAVLPDPPLAPTDEEAGLIE